MKKIIFVTGTRADYGKLKSLIIYLQKNNKFKVYVFVTGMHNLKKFGSTWDELRQDKIKNIFRFINQKEGHSMDNILSKTISGFSKFSKDIKPDLIVIHGDRIETLACAIVGSLNNFRTAHIEGGEISGTIDEILRHSISKLSHIHFVSNKIAKNRLIQMGEIKKNIFVIGSPDIDVIRSKKLPNLDQVKEKYSIKFQKYAIAIFHPVTTELHKLKKNCDIFLKSIINSNFNYIVLYPNNDTGSDEILRQYKRRLYKKKNIRLLPSMRFEYYLTLLKNSYFLIGNSSSGIIEAPFYGIPSINIGNRQNKRSSLKTIKNCDFFYKKISKFIKYFSNKKVRYIKNLNYGNGDSFIKFNNILNKNIIWRIDTQKQFQDIS